MPTEGGVRKKLDLELFDEKEAAKLAELAGEYDRDQNLVPMVLGGTGPVRVINVLELEVPEQWRERYYPRGMPQPPTVSPEARKRWTDIEPDSKLVEQVPTEEREQWRDLEEKAIDRRLVDMDRNWMEMAQFCGVGGEPQTVRILREEKLLPALGRWRPVLGDKHFRRLCDMWTARLSAREMELRYREGPAAEPEQVQIPDKKKSRTGSKAQLRDDLIASVMTDNPDASDKELCEILDRKPLPVLDTWPEKTWLGNLRSDDPKVRSRVKKHLSGLRAELGLGKRTKSELTIELP